MTTELVEKPKVVRLDEYTVPDFLIPNAYFEIDIFNDHTIVRSKLEICRNEDSINQDSDLVLNGENMDLISVSLNGHVLNDDAYSLSPNTLTVHGVSPRFTLEVENKIDPSSNTALEGIYQSGSMICSQCESEGFRRITYFVDRPDVMCHMKTKVIADKKKYPILLSNGNQVSAADLDNGRHFTLWDDPFAKPCYLFAVVAGDLKWVEDTFTTMSGREIALKIYVEKGNEDKCAWAMDSLKRSMKWDEDVFGLEYDLDLFNIVAVSSFNMGAMENKGLNIFNSSAVLALPETATDANFESIEGIVAHEYFHNWTGNRVTCRDWFQLTLKEGLTVFRDQQFSAQMNSEAVHRLTNVRALRYAQFPEDAGPMAHPIRPSSYIEINNFYTSTVYQKGAEIIRMIQTLLGEELFRKGMDRYFEVNDGQAVTCEDFVKAMADVSGFDFTQFMLWYKQAGTPKCQIEGSYDEVNKTFTVTIEQSCPKTPETDKKKPFFIPFSMGLIDSQGNDMPLQLSNGTKAQNTMVLHVKNKKESFTFINIPEKPVPSYLRDFSAPIKMKANLTVSDYIFLLSHDKNKFNCYEAGKRLARYSLRELIKCFQNNAAPKIDTRIFEAYHKALTNLDVDESFRAEVLAIPSIAELVEEMDVCDFDSAEKAVNYFKKTFAENYKESLISIYHSIEQKEFEINAKAFGQRRLKNFCLSYLNKLDTPDIHQLVQKHFETASNMTDEISALSLLVDSSHKDYATKALKAFETKWMHDSLVMDKFFTVQALSKDPDIVEKLKVLENHEAFDKYNPNKLRSLISAFSMNLIYFHDISGKGYEYVADKILEIDKFNSQFSGRLSTSFKKYNNLDPVRQELMKVQLERILDEDGLSKDVYEVISKTLGLAQVNS